MVADTILITGGAGFIGSHLCKRLLSEGNFVVCVDNLSTGSEDNIETIVNNKNFEFIKADICDTEIQELLSKRRYTQIYHLASPASVTYITQHPIEAAFANSVGTINLLDLAKKQSAKLLFASSSEAYGDPKEHPQKESYWGNVNCVGVRSGYDEGKRFGEALCMAYWREQGIDVKIIRIFNTYGPNSRPDDTRVIPQFVTQALLQKPLLVHGDGTQTRSFCYVSDMVDGMVKMMNSTETGPVNLGNPIEYKIIEVAQKIVKMTGSTSEISFVERPKDDPKVRQPDISLAKKVLSWEPQISPDEGFLYAIDYFKKVLKV